MSKNCLAEQGVS